MRIFPKSPKHGSKDTDPSTDNVSKVAPKMPKGPETSSPRDREVRVSARQNEQREQPEPYAIDFWEDRMNHQPSHCLSFLTGGKSKSSRSIDFDNLSINTSITKFSQGYHSGAYVPKAIGPLQLIEMKERTLSYVDKQIYPIGHFPWIKVEEMLQIWTHQGTEESVHLSVLLMNRMVDEHQKAPDWSDSQMTSWLKSLVKNWNKGQRTQGFSVFTPTDMLERVEAWCHIVDSDPEIFALVIDGAAASEPWLADCLLRRTVESHEKGSIYTKTYNSVLRAWAEAADPYQAEDLLDFMLDEWNHRGESSIVAKPNRSSFHWVLLAWSKASELEAPERTEKLLEKMESFSQDQNLSSVQPDAVTYKWVLRCIVKAPTKNAEASALRAQSILDKLKAKADAGEEDLRPTTELYSLVIEAWGRAGDPQRSEGLMHQLYRDYCELGQDKRLQPDLRIFNNILIGYARVCGTGRHRRAAERAEQIFDHMGQLALNGTLPIVAPDINSHNILLDCYSRCGDGAKADKLIENMVKQGQEGIPDIEPNTLSYAKVLGALARAGDFERCEKITNELLAEAYTQLAQGRNCQIHPNLILDGLAKFGHPNSDTANKALRLLTLTTKHYESGSSTAVKPTSISYESVLQCLLKSDLPDAGCRAEALLNEMISKYEDGNNDLNPNVNIYNLVMRAIEKCETNPGTRTESILQLMYQENPDGQRVQPNLESFEIILRSYCIRESNSSRGEKILKRMQKIHDSGVLQHVKPDVECYNIVLESLAHHTPGVDAGKRAERLLDVMKDHEVKPSDVTYGYVIEALTKCGDKHRAKLYKAILTGKKSDE